MIFKISLRVSTIVSFLSSKLSLFTQKCSGSHPAFGDQTACQVASGHLLPVPLWRAAVQRWTTVQSGKSFFFLKCQLPSHVRLFVTPWTIAHQAPPSTGFSRREHWSGLPCFPPGGLLNPGVEPASLALQADSLQKVLILLFFRLQHAGSLLHCVGSFIAGHGLLVVACGLGCSKASQILVL